MSSKSQPPLKSSFLEGEIHLTPPAFVSNSDYIAVVERLLDERRQQMQWHRQTVPKFEALLNELRNEVINKVGERQWNEFREYIRERRRSNHGLNQFNHDRDSLAKLELAQRETKNRVSSLMEAASVERDDLTGIRQKYIDEIKNVLYSEQQVEVVPENEVPKRILEATEHNQP